MKVFVYGTLKQGYGNNRLLSNAKFLEQKVLKGFKLYDAGFPVAVRSEGDSVLGEVYEIKEGDQQTLLWLDRLEGEGRMYNREQQEDVNLYVGHPQYWNVKQMKECHSENDLYIWERSW